MNAETLKNNYVVWFEIYVADMGRTKTFYQNVFKCELKELPTPVPDLEMFAFPWVEKGPGAAGALVKGAAMKPGSAGALVYFSCEDCAVETGRVKSSGGKVLQEKISIGEYGFMSLVQDTEGNTIGLHSMR